MHHYSQRLPKSRPQGSQTPTIGIECSLNPDQLDNIWHQWRSRSVTSDFYFSQLLFKTAWTALHFFKFSTMLDRLQHCLLSFTPRDDCPDWSVAIGACMDIHAPSKYDSRNLQLHFAMNIPGSTVFGLYPLCSSMHRTDAKTLKVDVILTIWIDRDPDRHLMFFATLWAGQLVSIIICYQIVLMPLHAFFGQQQQTVVATGTVPSPSSASIPMALTKDQQT